MSKVGFKVRDKGTQTFWNGDVRWSKFDETGRTWKTKPSVENSIAHFFRYSKTFNIQTLSSMPEKWEIVEVVLSEVEQDTHDITDFLAFSLIKSEINKVNYKYAWFLETMRKRGVDENVEFIFKLKPFAGNSRVCAERIKEARAHLRQLGVKTRTFREYNGMFGMMNREQAMRARLTLDVDEIVDLGDIRRKVHAGLGKTQP